MDALILVNRVLDDERLTADLEGDEAATMVRWLVSRAEAIARTATSEVEARASIEKICARAQAIGRLVGLLRQLDEDAARDFAAAQGLACPADLPVSEALQTLLDRE